MDIALGILLVAGVLAVVAYPLWRPAPEPAADPVGPAAELRELEHRKATIYGAIRDLGFDYRTDKLLEEDYREEVTRLKAEAVEVVRRIDELAGSAPRGPEHIEAEIEAARRRLEAPSGAADAVADERGRFCTQCGAGADAEDRFCAACGAQLRAPA